MAIKAGILGGTAITLVGLQPSSLVARLIMVLVLALFLIWDTVTVFPILRLVHSRLLSAGYSPRKALGEIVATNVLDQVLKESQQVRLSRRNTILLALAGTNETQFKSEIAEAVSNIAAETSWEDLRPYMLFAGGQLAALMLLYGIFVAIVVHLV